MRPTLFAYQSKRKIGTVMLLTLAAGLLGGCETDGGPPNPLTELAAYRTRNEVPAKPADKPKTRAEVALDCWSIAEKSHTSASLDAKADFVTKCIDGKMKTSDAKSDAKSDGKPDSKPGTKPGAAARPGTQPKQAAAAKPAS